MLQELFLNDFVHEVGYGICIGSGHLGVLQEALLNDIGLELCFAVQYVCIGSTHLSVLQQEALWNEFRRYLCFTVSALASDIFHDAGPHLRTTSTIRSVEAMVR